jgi:hypothetical protein
MIVYNLLCDNAHRFEGWFASPEAFEHQHDARQLSCPVCGSASVQRQPSAPHVHTRAAEAVPVQAVMAKPEMLRQIRAQFVDYLLKNTEDVGERFPEEARAIFYEQAPERPIRGRATLAEADQLREEGIEVFALPAPRAPKDKLH